MVELYVGTERTIAEQVNELLELGTSTGERLIATVTPTYDVIIDTVASSADTNPVLGTDGRLRHPQGTPLEPGALIAGRYIFAESLPLLDALTRSRAGEGIYIRESEFDAAAERLMLQSEGAPDPWQVARI